MRTIVDLDPDQRERLDALARVRNISRAEAIRRAVDRLLADAREQDDARPQAFGLWRDRCVDVQQWEDALRAEWSSGGDAAEGR